jgi:hypothetical protein
VALVCFDIANNAEYQGAYIWQKNKVGDACGYVSLAGGGGSLGDQPVVL